MTDAPTRSPRPFERLISAVESWYLDPAPVYPIVAMRILLGLWMTLQYVLYAPYMADMFGPDGVVVVMLDESTWLIEHYRVVWFVLIGASFCYCVGFASRASGLLAIICHVAFHKHAWGFTWGDGTMGHAFIFYTLLGHPGARLSVDAWIRRRLRPDSVPRETIQAWPLRLIQLHVCAVYFMAAVNRIHSLGWLQGRMTAVAISNSLFTRFPNVEWLEYRAILWIATWYTWIVELLAPINLWRPRLRTTWVVLLIAMHLGLELSSTIGWWQFYMMTALITFMPPAWPKTVITRAERALGLAP